MDSIEYSITRSLKRKTLSIVIRPDNQIDVLAPKRMPAARIHQFVHDKQRWIQKKLHFNQHIRTNYQPKSFLEGEVFPLLGETIVLTIRKDCTAIHLSGKQLIVPSFPADKLKKQLIIWYRKQAEQHLQQRAQSFLPAIGKQPACIGVKAYKSRWGSCHHDGRIYFNYRLIMAPVWVIDYVIVHELCHLIHHNHSNDFWQLVAHIMPDYPQSKTWLKNNALSLDL